MLKTKTRRCGEVTRLSGSVAERLSHGDVAHSWRTDGLSVIEGLNPPGGPGKGTETGSKNLKRFSDSSRHRVVMEQKCRTF